MSKIDNIYGPNQYPEKVIPKFICQLLNNEKMTIHGNGSGKRNFIHVKDVCDAYDIIIHKGKIGEIYNISASENNEFSVLEIATMLIALMNVDPNLIEYVDDRIFNDCRYYTSSEKLKNLGWHPVHVNFKENVLDLISWYKINKDRYL